MTCYLLRAGDTNRVKIGWTSDNVSSRIQELQAGCWEPLILVRTWDGGRTVEAWLHRQFSHLRIAREWFVFDAAMLEIEPTDLRDVPTYGAVSKIIDALGGVPKISKALNLPLTTAGNWKLRNSIPARHHHQLMVMSGGSLTANQIVEAHHIPNVSNVPEAA